MDRRWIYASCTTGALALGLVIGLDTVRAMDPLPPFIPAQPRAPYEAPQTVPADMNAYPVAVILPPQRDPGPRLVEASYAPDEEGFDMRDHGGALATSKVPSQVEIDPLPDAAPDDETGAQ